MSISNNLIVCHFVCQILFGQGRGLRGRTDGRSKWTGKPKSGTIVVHRLGLAMIKPYIKFEMSTIICDEEMKGNAKCKKILVLSHPLGDLGVTYTVCLYFVRVVSVRLLK